MPDMPGAALAPATPAHAAHAIVRCESIDYQDGMTVMKGAKLFGIERDTYQAQLDQAKASLASQQASDIVGVAPIEQHGEKEE